MKIALDVRTITPTRSGVGNYVLHLLRGLERVAPQHQFFLVGQAGNFQTLGRDLPEPGSALCTRLSHESHPLGDLWEHLWLPGALDRSGVDVLHGPATLVPLTSSRHASVVTIHDLVAFLFPDTIPHKYALYMRWLIRRVVHRADHIISVSQNTKDDLVQVLGIAPEKITVVHEAATSRFQPVEDPMALETVRRRYGIDRPFFYHLGNIEPRKNLVRLIKAFLKVRSQRPGQVKLVISGQKGWLTNKIFRTLGPMDYGEDIIFTGYLPTGDLPLLMNASLAFVFPSLYEGFGLPVLEAMCCGTPVITSNISSLPEIVGGAAVLVDPYDERAIAGGMARVLDDADLRARLRRKGIERARGFSWERAAEGTLKVYRRALDKKAGLL